MYQHFRPYICIIFFYLFSPMTSAAVEGECPTSIPLESAQARDIPSGWHASHRQRQLSLSHAFVNTGLPEELADLVPSETKKSGNSSVSVWHFDSVDHEHGIWVSCGYEKGVILLSQKIPGTPQSCTLEYRQIKNKNLSVRFLCQ